jgi:histidyl-tRNA synthetase
MVRGLDYYCRTTFEWTTTQLGSQSAVAAGGRYDGLVEQLGGPPIPGVGFAMGLERLTMLLKIHEEAIHPGPDVYLVWVGEKARNWVFPIAHRLRQRNLVIEMEGESRSLKSQMRRADKFRAASVLIVGDDELAKGEGVLRDMASKRQESIKLENIEAELSARKAG